VFEELLEVFADLAVEDLDDLFDDLPGRAELKALCENRAFQLICHACEHVRTGKLPDLGSALRSSLEE